MAENGTPFPTADFLREIPLFASLSVDEIALLNAASEMRHYHKDSLIFKAGDATSRVFFVCAGQVAEFINYDSCVEYIVKVRDKYDHIGLVGAFGAIPQPTTALALADSELLALPSELILNLAHHSASMMRMVNRELVNKLLSACKSLVSSVHMSAPGRLAFTLLRMSNKLNSSHEGALNITQKELASTAGMARQTASAILSTWNDLGYITTHRKRIIINHSSELMDIVIKDEIK